MDFSTFFFFLLFVLLWHGHWELPLEPISTIGAYCTKYQFDLQVILWLFVIVPVPSTLRCSIKMATGWQTDHD